MYGERGRLEVLEDAAGSASSACWGLLIGRESLLSVGDGEEGGFSPSYLHAYPSILVIYTAY